jgi:mRNA interferase MazF
MKPGDIVLIRLPQVGSPALKLRPAMILALLPGSYQNVLICGVSTKLHQLEAGWDELISSSHPDFGTSGLHHESSIRLSYLYAADS